jgi:hypothetical protein
MAHAPEQAHAMPCCPSHVASIPANFFAPPPCCDLTNQPARPLAVVVVPGKSRSGQFSVRSTAGALAVPQPSSAFLLVAESLPFVKPVFDKKTDLRI